MKFCVVINCEPDCETAAHAFAFCKALVCSEHKLAGVMLVEQGVKLVSSDSKNAWLSLTNHQSFLIHCCANAVNKYNIAESLNAPFTLSGLGQLVALNANTDRVITFGERKC